MSALILALIPTLPTLVRAGYDLVEVVKDAIAEAPDEDRPAIDAAWNAIAADLDSALDDYNSMKKDEGLS